MSSIATRVSTLSDDKRQVLLDKLRIRSRSSRIQPRAHINGHAPLSYAQVRLWFLQQLDRTSAQYNLPAAVRIEGPLDISVLEKCFGELIRRHESLRTIFPVIEGEPVQAVLPAFAIHASLA